MSVTAGIPLARGVSERIVMFEYLLSVAGKRPWRTETTSPITYRADLLDFLDWYEEENGSERFSLLAAEAAEWLGATEPFLGVKPDEPKCYQLLFQHLLQDSTIHHKFLSALVRRARGVNLAHLGLAGILRDYPEWGHTVFTTNFDDLLLKSLLTINHTARVFGDMQSEDRPSLRPSYPQVVHLHGRHTGYRLLNSREQVALVDPGLQEGFKRHIADSHLVVLGYSGWDDLVMTTLAEWPSRQTLIRGNVFWIPFRSEATILPEVRQFLDQCPPGRVSIVTDESRNLDADQFVLRLSDALSRDSGGFARYRSSIIQHAQEQHRFVLGQLKLHVGYHPSEALILASRALDALAGGDEACARGRLDAALAIARESDCPIEIVARVKLLVGKFFMHLREYEAANQAFRESESAWAGTPATAPDREQARAQAVKHLAECLFLSGELEEAEIAAKRAISRCRYKVHGSEEVTAYANKLLGDILLRRGNALGARGPLRQARNYFEGSEDEYGLAITCRSFAEAAFRLGDFEVAAVELKQSAALWRQLGSTVGMSGVLLLSSQFAHAINENGWAARLLEMRAGLHVSPSAEVDGAQCIGDV
ncbi:MAG: SIR2 family protein [bacterium]|nr:SIR2 family protein [bacterium]